MVNTFQDMQSGPSNSQILEPVRYPTAISTIRLPIFTQQIMVVFQLLQEAWNKLSSEMNKMAEINKLLMKAVKSTYKRLTNGQK